MNKILLTTRDPGPTIFLCEILRNLSEKFEVHLVVNSSMKDFISTRYPHILKIKKLKIIEVILRNKVPKLITLENFLFNLFKNNEYSMIIRTTPAYGIGIDEIVSTVAYEAGFRGEVVVIQDFYGVGNILNDNEHKHYKKGGTHLLTVDELSKTTEEKTFQGKVYNTGWINHEEFLYQHKSLNKKEKLKAIYKKKKHIILYACSAVDDLSDIYVYEKVIMALERLDIEYLLIVKFHPKFDRRIKSLYKKKNENILFSDELQYNYNDYLIISDLLISIGSMMNIDSMAYVSCFKEKSANFTISFFIRDSITDSVIKRGLGNINIPIFKEDNGSIISDISSLENKIYRGLNDHLYRDKIHTQSNKIYKPKQGIKNKIIKILEEIERGK